MTTKLFSHLWYWAWRKLNSSLILSHDSATVNLNGCPGWGGPCEGTEGGRGRKTWLLLHAHYLPLFAWLFSRRLWSIAKTWLPLSNQHSRQPINISSSVYPTVPDTPCTWMLSLSHAFSFVGKATDCKRAITAELRRWGTPQSGKGSAWQTKEGTLYSREMLLNLYLLDHPDSLMHKNKFHIHARYSDPLDISYKRI